jgi:hypothetical protein
VTTTFIADTALNRHQRCACVDAVGPVTARSVGFGPALTTVLGRAPRGPSRASTKNGTTPGRWCPGRGSNPHGSFDPGGSSQGSTVRTLRFSRMFTFDAVFASCSSGPIRRFRVLPANPVNILGASAPPRTRVRVGRATRTVTPRALAVGEFSAVGRASGRQRADWGP